jgi:hypothetical protein
MRILSGRCTESEQAIPFNVLTAMLSGLGDDRADAEPGQANPARLQHMIRGVLSRCVRGGARVLILDDSHWVDSASLELAGYLVRWLLPDPLSAPSGGTTTCHGAGHHLRRAPGLQRRCH